MLDVRADFPILERQINGKPIVYLDSAATSLKPRCVIDAVTNFYTLHTANVHRAVHALAEEATEQFEDTRRVLARLINCDENEAVFVRGTTEAINMVHRCYPGLKRSVTTAIEHHSNLLPWGFGPDRHIVSVDAEGRIDMDALDAVLAGGIDLVAVSHVSNAIGAVQPIKDIIDRAHAAGALVLVDAAQSAPHLPLDVKELDVDFLGFSAHKMLGPGGIGCLYAKAEHLDKMSTWMLGGHVVDQVHREGYTLQEVPHRFEAGTPAIEAVIGWGAALRYLAGIGLDNVHEHDRELVTYARNRLSDIDHVKLIGPTDPQRSGSAVSFQVDGLEAHGVARMLNNRENIMVRSGFHCAQPLHESLDLLPTVRASFYVYNTKEEVDSLAQCLEAVIQFL